MKVSHKMPYAIYEENVMVIEGQMKFVQRFTNIFYVSLHCDSCSGQNKNRSTLVMLFYFLAESSKIKSIKITFLLPVHTYMPVDSIHGTIERFIKNHTVWKPNLETVKLRFTDFMDWKQLSKEILHPKAFKSVEGESIKITQVRSVYFEKE